MRKPDHHRIRTGRLSRRPYIPLRYTAVGSRATTGLLLLLLLFCTPSNAQQLDDFGPPPQGDPSAYGFPLIGEEFAVDGLEGLPPVNSGALEGGPTGTAADAGINNVVSEGDETSDDIPSGGPPSPLFGAQSFTQQMLLFEEMAVRPYSTVLQQGGLPFPLPGNTTSGPDEAALEAFLAQAGLSPLPTQFSNTEDENPWKAQIEGFLRRDLETPPAEGRPPGKGWSHQRWNEFFPQGYFKSAQAGARVNRGLRDNEQMHGYGKGEFGPGGLYHKVYTASVEGAPTLEGTTRGLGIRFHPNMPIQEPNTLWTFDGTLPPKLLMARHGQTILFRHYNALPIDPSANRGFGLHTITTHEHNGHTPAESDGYTAAFFFPGQYFDYRWPLALAGYDSINTDAGDPRAAFPCAPGETLFVNDREPGVKQCENGSIKIRGDWRETASTHWFHDHMLDFTAQNVYKGNAAMMNYYSAVDRGKEDHYDGVNLRLPSGTALPWGNRDYDVNLLIADKAWDRSGQLWFNIFNRDGFMGDQIMTNWLYHPYFDVRARRYRFRILNGSVARYFKLALVRQINGPGGEMPGPGGSGVSYSRVPFHLIANDGNIMEHAIPFDGSMDLDRDGDFSDHHAILPTQSIAERYDIVVDFGKHGIQPGDKLYFVNVLEHDDGRRPKDTIPLREVLSEEYKALARDDDGDGIPDRWRDGDPGVGKFLELRVHSYTGVDHSMDPSDYIPGRKKMIPLSFDRDDPADRARLANARHRTFEFVRSSGTDESPWTIKTDGGGGLTADPRRISAAPQLATGPTEAGYVGEATLEVWSFHTGGGWSHPVHAHFEEGIILTRDGEAPPEWEKWARKDMFRIGSEEDSSRVVEIAIQFREFAGTYVEHCHNTTHEDHAMLLRWDLELPGQVELMPTPLPTWDGVEFVDSVALPTFRDGDGFGPEFVLGPVLPAPDPGAPAPGPAPQPEPPPAPESPGETPPPAPEPEVPARTPTRLELRIATMIERTEARMELERNRPAPRPRTLQSLQRQLERLQVRLAAAQQAAQRPRR
ncbi:MAG: multicopper oxidase domain-containing protein [Syntrophobacteraceae bacterium]|nr:multicopper oxidase domain-containing protein [Syntrophobacteraceae bacterium]